MEGEEMYEDYRAAALASGIFLPLWFRLNVIQRIIWNTMAEGYDGAPK